MLYQSSIQLDLIDAKAGLLKFCELAIQVGGIPTQAEMLLKVLDKEEIECRAKKFAKFANRVTQLVSVTLTRASDTRTVPLQQRVHVIQHLSQEKGNKGAIIGIQIFYQINSKAGVCLNISRLYKTVHLLLRLSKLSKAERCAAIMSMPVPTVIPEWPMEWPKIERAPTVKKLPDPPKKLDLLLPVELRGSKIPLGEILDLIEKYR